MTTTALLALAAVLLAWSPRRTVVTRRMGAVPVGARTPTARVPTFSAPGRRRAFAASASVPVGALAGGVGGVVAGILTAALVAVAVERLLGRPAENQRVARAALARDLPIACDLLAVCLGAGVPPGGALQSVASSVPGPVAQSLTTVAGLYRLGAEPRQAWADAPAELASLGRVVVRAGESGARAVPALEALASECRAAARSSTEVAVRRAGVWVLAPLGACFLPAFICLGVVPTVLGIAGEVLG